MELAAVTTAAPADARTREAWLERLYQAHANDQIPYIESVTKDLASRWADRLLGITRNALSPDTQMRGHYHGTTMCLTCLFHAERYEELLELLEHEHFWPYERRAVRALAATGRNDDALALAEATTSRASLFLDMPNTLQMITDGSNTRTFDVICAGEALWNFVEPGRGVGESAASFRPGGGAVNAALELARQGLTVGLATVLADDTFGRSLRDRIAAASIDAAGVQLSKLSSGLFFVEGGARQVASFREEEQPVEIPLGWGAQIMLLSGMSPIVSHAAALCKAARAARRVGTIVVVDVNARWALWKGRDPRAIRMILREADVVWCSAEDLFGLNMDLPSVRSAMRASAVLAMSDAMGKTWATGPFGEVVRSAAGSELVRHGDSNAFATAICAELARAGHTSPTSGDLWARALEHGHTIAKARAR